MGGRACFISPMFKIKSVGGRCLMYFYPFGEEEGMPPHSRSIPNKLIIIDFNNYNIKLKITFFFDKL
jgi:hypothetical protein